MFHSHNFRAPPSPQDILFPKNDPVYKKVIQDLGPVTLANVSEGLRNYTWELGFMEGWWVIHRVDNPDATVEVIVDTGLVEAPEFVDITFDPAGRAFIAWEEPNVGIQIFWYDPTIPGYTTTLIVQQGRNPFCHLDYRILQQQVKADIILCYEKDNAVYYRITSNRYTVEYSTPFTDLGNRRIHKAGVGEQLRYTIYVA